MGVFYIDIEDYDNAVITYKQGVANFPENNLMWCNLAVANLMNKDFDSAKVACDKAIDIKPDSVMPNLCMVYIYLANGEYGKARRHLEGKTKHSLCTEGDVFRFVRVVQSKQGGG